MQVSPTEQILPQRPQLLESFMKVMVSTQLPWQDSWRAEHPAILGFALGGGATACTGGDFDGIPAATWPGPTESGCGNTRSAGVPVSRKKLREVPIMAKDAIAPSPAPTNVPIPVSRSRLGFTVNPFTVVGCPAAE